MAEKVRCEICDRTFKDIEGLAQHNTAKHSSSSREVKTSVNAKKVRNWAIFVVILGLIIGGIYLIVSSTVSGINYCKIAPVIDTNIGGHTNVKLHVHSNLRIVIDGKEQFIPANIGVSPGIMRPLHTHEPDNKIHIEGLCPREFTIGEFFQVWGKRFDSECIFDKCTDSGGLRMIVNGKENKEFDKYVMRDEDKIVIEFVSVKVNLGNGTS